MDVYPFKTLYIADLNAIQSLSNTGKNHISILAEIKQAFPKLSIWLDAGSHRLEQIKDFHDLGVTPVLGSESFQTIAEYQHLTKQLGSPYVLSLDFMPQGYTGPSQVLSGAAQWPDRVIVMTLANVGANAGVDLVTLKQVIQKKEGQQIYAAGGIRHRADLMTLKSLDVQGALIASALHQKSITSKDLIDLHT